LEAWVARVITTFAELEKDDTLVDETKPIAEKLATLKKDDVDANTAVVVGVVGGGGGDDDDEVKIVDEDDVSGATTADVLCCQLVLPSALVISVTTSTARVVVNDDVDSDVAEIGGSVNEVNNVVVRSVAPRS
jgi:hypothetical protein